MWWQMNCMDVFWFSTCSQMSLWAEIVECPQRWFVSQLSDVKVTDVHSNLASKCLIDLSEPAPDLFHFLVVVCPWTGGESAESCSFSAESYQSWGGGHVARREALTRTKRLIPKPWISGSLSLEISFSSWKGHRKSAHFALANESFVT